MEVEKKSFETVDRTVTRFINFGSSKILPPEDVHERLRESLALVTHSVSPELYFAVRTLLQSELLNTILSIVHFKVRLFKKTDEVSQMKRSYLYLNGSLKWTPIVNIDCL